jgi:urease accessory protein
MGIWVLTQRQSHKEAESAEGDPTLSLTAQERTRARYRFRLPSGEEVLLQLPRGTVLRQGDRLGTSEGNFWVTVQAQPEPVLTVRASSPLALLQAAYHLGNRHVPLEIRVDFLRLEPDPVLRDLLEQRGLSVTEEVVGFFPEEGAYGGHSH